MCGSGEDETEENDRDRRFTAVERHGGDELMERLAEERRMRRRSVADIVASRCSGKLILRCVRS